MKRISITLLALLTLAGGFQTAQAQDANYKDTIIQLDGTRLDNVKVTDENSDEVIYEMAIAKGTPQTISQTQVDNVVYNKQAYDYDRGVAAEEGGNPQEALRFYDRAVEKATKGQAPSWSLQYALYRKGSAALASGDAKVALEAFAKLLERKPDTKFLRDMANLGFDAYIQQGDSGGAQAWIDKFRDLPGFTERYKFMQARLSESKSDFAQAMRSYSELANKASDESVRIEATLGNLRMMRKSKSFGQIQGVANRILNNKDEHPDLKGAAWAAMGDFKLNEAESAAEGEKGRLYKEALLAFLRPVVQYPPSTGYAEYHARALLGAGICFDRIRPFIEEDKRGKYYRYAYDKYSECAQVYAGSEHGQEAKKAAEDLD